MPETDSRLLHLDLKDNVFTVVRTLDAGQELQIGGKLIRLAVRLPLGHKIAARRIAAGEKVYKYGVPIGSAKTAIEPGEHVHTHNLQSDYLPTYTFEPGKEYVKVKELA